MNETVVRFAEVFPLFRDCDLASFAIDLAAAENVGSVRLLCERHAADLRPVRLAIVEGFPETVRCEMCT